MKLHSIHQLYDQRLAQSTKPFRARGASVVRCIHCMVVERLCICAERRTLATHAGFLLVMYDDEVLKPSNTGRLIADTVKDTFAYIWSRKQPNEEMLALIKDPRWQPFVVFPGQYADEQRVVSQPVLQEGKRPLFIMIDGTWSEAKKIFRKSPWLDTIPVLSIKPDAQSRYQMREAAGECQLATAEVAARVLELAGEKEASACLDAWFDVFREHYLTGKRQLDLPIPGALDKFREIRPA
ncbi:DTW domain-containing protein [Enterovibrio sp. ZSDZ42]|uniref:tRNA-uridine aminocarboxypropyltransferase n=1 Tax=Enterovibrio gelatinilyticus TaxID=2899819 RepID=A0ABT5QVQ6_9GAMM|nr:tRNA-uridine aminocarboxypropyltransferase [Enterovibrio sp. ZSDZ42]MDD1791680.1 DTW domain-containing protein [Enterovibrio sp. ZSDZ42]